jgi:multidomain signaling protein FimX
VLHLLEQLEQRLDEDPPAGVQALVLVALDDLHKSCNARSARAGSTSCSPGWPTCCATRCRRATCTAASARPSSARWSRAARGATSRPGRPASSPRWSRTCSRRAASPFSLSVSAGIALADRRGMDLDVLYAEAARGARQGPARSASARSAMSSHEQDSPRMEELDQLWVKRIKRALLDNRFRLADQPIASLTGRGRQNLQDIFVRMIDEQGDDVLPSHFVQAAERNRLIKNIDRWVIGAAFAFCQSRPKAKVFVRLSKDTMLDNMLPAWLETRRKNARLPEGVIVFQVSEETAASHLRQTHEMADRLRKIGFCFALEGFTGGADPGQVLAHLPMDYLKIDGSLMQGLASDERLQEKVKTIVQEARDHEVRTIAERVEDANTMAVLWQLGVHYIQGYQIREPEVVLSAGDD